LAFRRHLTGHHMILPRPILFHALAHNVMLCPYGSALPVVSSQRCLSPSLFPSTEEPAHTRGGKHVQWYAHGNSGYRLHIQTPFYTIMASERRHAHCRIPLMKRTRSRLCMCMRYLLGCRGLSPNHPCVCIF
jgi:hypothetical protein